MKTILIIPTSVENERVLLWIKFKIGLLQNFYHSMFIITSKVDEHLRRSVSVWYSNSHICRSRDHEEKVQSCFVISFGTDSSWSKQLLNSFKNLILCLN